METKPALSCFPSYTVCDKSLIADFLKKEKTTTALTKKHRDTNLMQINTHMHAAHKHARKNANMFCKKKEKKFKI